MDRDSNGRFIKGRKDPKKGTGKKYYCQTCGQEISKKKYKNCYKCNLQLRKGKNSNFYGKHPWNYKGIINSKCFCKCGERIKVLEKLELKSEGVLS